MNHSTGEYHYHHGYSAHDHYDMDGDGNVDCPYDFNDQTSNQKNYMNDKETTVEDENPPQHPMAEEWKSIAFMLLTRLCVIIAGWYIFYIVTVKLL